MQLTSLDRNATDITRPKRNWHHFCILRADSQIHTSTTQTLCQVWLPTVRLNRLQQETWIQRLTTREEAKAVIDKLRAVALHVVTRKCVLGTVRGGCRNWAWRLWYVSYFLSILSHCLNHWWMLNNVWVIMMFLFLNLQIAITSSQEVRRCTGLCAKTPVIICKTHRSPIQKCFCTWRL